MAKKQYETKLEKDRAKKEYVEKHLKKHITNKNKNKTFLGIPFDTSKKGAKKYLENRFETLYSFKKVGKEKKS
jgi:hypothetical protein|tara:strand:- start:68 stop:286 length:219 start_codon:yes stop_codon:yes gene_type:complete